MRKNMNFTPEELTPPNTCYADMHHVALDVKKASMNRSSWLQEKTERHFPSSGEGKVCV